MKLLALLGEEALKERIKEIIKKLVDYPLSLRELDVEKLEGASTITSTLSPFG
jgi:Trp operon repressor